MIDHHTALAISNMQWCRVQRRLCCPLCNGTLMLPLCTHNPSKKHLVEAKCSKAQKEFMHPSATPFTVGSAPLHWPNARGSTCYIDFSFYALPTYWSLWRKTQLACTRVNQYTLRSVFPRTTIICTDLSYTLHSYRVQIPYLATGL